MKKILIYIDSMNPAGGIERVIANLTNQWIKKYKVSLIVKDIPEPFYHLDSDISIISIKNPINLDMYNRFSRITELIKNVITSHKSLKKNIDNVNPDIIYTANPINSLEIMLLGKKYLNKLIISEHGSKFGYNRIYVLLKKIVYPFAYKISVPTTLDTESYQQEGYPAIFIPHLSTFKDMKKTDYNNKFILNIGRLTSDKQQIKLLKIWENIVKENKNGNWQMKIVGCGEERQKLWSYIKKNNLENTVRIYDPIKNVNQLFLSSSIFAFTSRHEGFGMVLLEAMSFGVPCISFDCPSGPRDIVDDNVNGYLIENMNSEMYKEKLVKLMKDKKLRKKFGENAYIKANNWDNQKILNKWDELITGVNQ